MPPHLSSPERSPPPGHFYPLPLGCDPSYVAGAHPFARLYAANGGRIGKANTRADCPCVGPAGQNAQPDRCHSYGTAAFRDLFGRCEGAITWARTHCAGNPRCDHKVGYWGPDGMELGRDSPLVLFQWYLANRPDRDCEGCGCEHGDGTCAGCLDVQGCPQPCQADLDAALLAPPRALPAVPLEAATPRASPRPATVGNLSTHPAAAWVAARGGETGCCRAADGGFGVFEAVWGLDEAGCRAACLDKGQACVAIELLRKGRQPHLYKCELHSGLVSHTVPVPGCSCWLRP